jgi:hypothetical protein
LIRPKRVENELNEELQYHPMSARFSTIDPIYSTNRKIQKFCNGRTSP